jgi:hypothetical protein
VLAIKSHMDIKNNPAYKKVASIELEGGTGEITKMCIAGDFMENPGTAY